jgi:hypothetical protein
MIPSRTTTRGAAAVDPAVPAAIARTRTQPIGLPTKIPATIAPRATPPQAAVVARVTPQRAAVEPAKVPTTIMPRTRTLQADQAVPRTRTLQAEQAARTQPMRAPSPEPIKGGKLRPPAATREANVIESTVVTVFEAVTVPSTPAYVADGGPVALSALPVRNDEVAGDAIPLPLALDVDTIREARPWGVHQVLDALAADMAPSVPIVAVAPVANDEVEAVTAVTAVTAVAAKAPEVAAVSIPEATVSIPISDPVFSVLWDVPVRLPTTRPSTLQLEPTTAVGKAFRASLTGHDLEAVSARAPRWSARQWLATAGTMTALFVASAAATLLSLGEPSLASNVESQPQSVARARSAEEVVVAHLPATAPPSLDETSTRVVVRPVIEQDAAQPVTETPAEPKVVQQAAVARPATTEAKRAVPSKASPAKRVQPKARRRPVKAKVAPPTEPCSSLDCL